MDTSPVTVGVTSIEDILPGGVMGSAVMALSVALLVIFTHVVVPHWSTRYGSYLVAFTVWMIWFVLAGANYLDQHRD